MHFMPSCTGRNEEVSKLISIVLGALWSSRVVCVCVFEWPAVVNMLMDRIHANTGLTFNSVLANLYRDGHDHVSWHADDEPALGHQPTIATLSFGDTRTFHLRKNPPPVRLLWRSHFILHLRWELASLPYTAVDEEIMGLMGALGWDRYFEFPSVIWRHSFSWPAEGYHTDMHTHLIYQQWLNCPKVAEGVNTIKQMTW